MSVRYSPAIASVPPRRPFDFTGNHPVIDFVNTVNGRPTFTRDDLATADDVFEWAIAARLLSSDEQVNRTADDAHQFAAAVTLRENLYSVFGPIADGESPLPEAVAFVARRAALATHSALWISNGASYEPRWPGNSLESVCDQLADAAVLLLRSTSVARIGSCAGCGWLFLDTSRAHARRWCSMNACGVRDKMRRYHQRHSSATSMA
jgi:predicted RNA-binding Zn ribbon-like protein